MPIRIYDAAAYLSVGPIWVILCSIITVLHSDVPTGTYCYVSRYPFPLESIGKRRHEASIINK